MNDCRTCANYKMFTEECSLNVATKEEIRESPVSTCLEYSKDNEWYCN